MFGDATEAIDEACEDERCFGLHLAPSEAASLVIFIDGEFLMCRDIPPV